MKYGVTREAVLGLEVVLPDGRVLQTGARTIKNVAGYDLTGLLTGSEGTLGVITAATLKLRPRPVAAPITVVAAFDSLAAAGEAVGRIVAERVEVSLLELMDEATVRAVQEWKRIGLEDVRALLLAQTDLAAADGSAVRTQAEQVERLCLAAGAASVAVSDDRREAEELLAVRRLAYPAMERLGACLVEDVGVPVSRLARMIERIEQIAAHHDVAVFTVAHAGDGNLHPTFVFDREGPVPEAVERAAEEVFAAALDLGGTITGEHGVGVVKRDWLGAQIGEVGLEVSRAVKAALDPLGLMNPGTMLG